MTDLRYAIRLLRKSPLFTTTIVFTLVIGIGATTAIFSVVNAILLRPLPFAEPERLMQVAEKNDKLNLPAFASSALNYLSWKEQTHAFDALGAIRFTTFTLSGHGDPETYTGNAISASLMPLLGLPTTLGRTFTDDETVPAPRPWRSSASRSGAAASAVIPRDRPRGDRSTAPRIRWSASRRRHLPCSRRATSGSRWRSIQRRRCASTTCSSSSAA